MNYSDIKYFSTVNGDGFRVSVFTSGCKFHCKGCFNREAWDFNYGKELTEEMIDKVLDALDAVYYDGLSILGGEPLVEENLEGTKHLIERFRERFGKKKNIWLWTGYYLTEMSEEQRKVADMCEYVVDGRFEIDKADKHYRFKGSSNQTIWKNKWNGVYTSED